jgi:putative phage-type endonuclease
MNDQIIDRIITMNKIDIYNIQEKDKILIYNVMKYINNIYINLKYIEDRIELLKKNIDTLEKLKKIPQMKQRSLEWYEARKNMITASDMAEALNKGKFGTQKNLIIKKVTNLVNVSDLNKNNNKKEYIAPLQWGIKYEDVACNIYKLKNYIDVNEFGLLKHHNKDITYFGASPDGISELGIMLEIKCPYKRKIDGIIPEQYYYQIQGQLDVCNLNECDYLECKFVEYNNEIDFLNDKTNDELTFENINSFTKDYREKGIIICYKNIDEDKMDYKYLYSNLKDTEEDMINWKKKQIKKFDIDIDYEINYWKLDTYEVQRVKKDKIFIKEKLQQIKKVWDKILYYSNIDNIEDYKKDILLSKKSKIFDFNQNKNNNFNNIGFINTFSIKDDN